MTLDLFSQPRAAPVMVPVPSDGPYSYLVPDGMDVAPGSIVRVPLGPRQVMGVVWDRDGAPVDPKKLRPISHAFPCPPIPESMRRFVEWIAAYTLSSPGLVARMLLRAPEAFDPEPPLQGLALSPLPPSLRMTPARGRVLDLLRDGATWTRSGLAHAAGVSASVVEGLLAHGALVTVALPPPPVVPVPDPTFQAPVLTADQAAVAARIRDAVAGGRFDVLLVDGVTGSGKTETYFEGVAAAIEDGRQALVLLPEIALTQAFLDRFERRFGAKPAEWHSDVPPRQRERVWRGVADGSVRVVAGARSALFLPFPELGLVVVDEEHDPAFKQEDRVVYHARDMAVLRGRFASCPVVLASATPSVESRVNADLGRYRRLVLPGRFSGASLPSLEAVDLRRHPPPKGRFLSPPLVAAIRDTIERGEQALLFLNRRGYAPLTLCRACGHRFGCPSCSAWLVEHRFRGTLNCHHCGHAEAKAEACPDCGALDHLVACGPGVERVTEEVVELFPQARALVLSSDMAGGVRRLRLELQAIAEGQADIVIGTQLVAKGHNFPKMTLVGVVDADLGLANGDPRASERTFQLLAQVTGRAGRTGLTSRGLIQTFQPDHPVMRALLSGDADSFYAREIAERERGAMPPFGRLAALVVSAENRADAEAHGRALRRAAPPSEEIRVLGPAEAPLAVVAGRHRFRLLVQGRRSADMQAYLRRLLSDAPSPRGSVRVQVDVDPQSFL